MNKLWKQKINKYVKNFEICTKHWTNERKNTNQNKYTNGIIILNVRKVYTYILQN